MTRHFDYCPIASEGDNQSVRSSAPVVSRCFPDGCNVKLYISRGRLAWWLLAFLHSVISQHCSFFMPVMPLYCYFLLGVSFECFATVMKYKGATEQIDIDMHNWWTWCSLHALDCSIKQICWVYQPRWIPRERQKQSRQLMEYHDVQCFCYEMFTARKWNKKLLIGTSSTNEDDAVPIHNCIIVQILSLSGLVNLEGEKMLNKLIVNSEHDVVWTFVI